MVSPPRVFSNAKSSLSTMAFSSGRPTSVPILDWIFSAHSRSRRSTSAARCSSRSSPVVEPHGQLLERPR